MGLDAPPIPIDFPPSLPAVYAATYTFADPEGYAINQYAIGGARGFEYPKGEYSTYLVTSMLPSLNVTSVQVTAKDGSVHGGSYFLDLSGKVTCASGALPIGFDGVNLLWLENRQTPVWYDGNSTMLIPWLNENKTVEKWKSYDCKTALIYVPDENSNERIGEVVALEVRAYDGSSCQQHIGYYTYTNFTSLPSSRGDPTSSTFSVPKSCSSSDKANPSDNMSKLSLIDWILMGGGVLLVLLVSTVAAYVIGARSARHEGSTQSSRFRQRLLAAINMDE